MQIDTAAVSTARAQVRDLKAKIEQFESDRILTREEATQNIDRFLDRVVADGDDRAAQAAVCASRPDLPIADAWSDFRKAEHAGNLAIWLDRDRMRKKLLAAVDALYKSIGDNAVPLADRPAHLARLKRELFDAEQVEFAMVENARNAGVAIEHRGDIDPRLLLGLTP